MAAPAPHPAAHAAPGPTAADEVSQLVLGGPAAWMPLVTGALHLLVNLAIGAGLLVITLWAASWAARVARNAAGRLHRGQAPDAVLQGFVGSLVRYGVIVIGLIAVLQQIGVQTTSVLAVLGAASLAIGLALQGGLSNVAAGVMLLLLRPYRIGDRVKIGDVVGRVNGLDLFVTRLHDLDNSVVFIPNSKAFGDVIINYSMPENRRIVMDFHIDYEDDVELALELLREAARADARIAAEPPPWAKVTELGESAVTVTLRAWTSPIGYRDTRFDLIKDVKAAFQREGLSFAYPHQVAVESRPWKAPDPARQAEARRARGATDAAARPGPAAAKRKPELAKTSRGARKRAG
ncbi:MAG TPA: mechanosensitive ion channel family protein [Caulobacteraceae bacterium]|jgi:small conductance mechanosensitive channel|nr:mechanosensitive ion channel family protein [Caulobacteraceae bacterium]